MRGDYMRNNPQLLDLLYQNMIEYFSGDPKRIQHFVKVHSFSRVIGHMEKLTEDELFILEAAAYVHDIGIKPAEEQFGKCDGKLQEELGPKQAEIILKQCGFSEQQIDRIVYLVGHHHTYTEIDGMDYQILVEADFLVNLYEDSSSAETIKHAYKAVFKTKSGTDIGRKMFGIE